MDGSPAAGLIPTEIFSRFADTEGQDREIAIPLPATPGLAQIKEVVITFGPESQGRPIDLSISGLKASPIVGRKEVAADTWSWVAGQGGDSATTVTMRPKLITPLSR